MKLFRLVAILGAVSLLIGLLPLVSASAPASIGTPTLQADALVDPFKTDILAYAITDGGVSGNGAAAFTIWFTVPSNVALGDVTVTAGPAFVAQTCNFATAMSSQPPIGGRNTIQLDGFCTTGAAGPRVTGDVVVATLTFSSAACSANPGGFIVDLTAEGDNTSLFEPDGTPYIFPAGALTDGGACGNPTAVQLANISAGPVAPIANALYPAMAGVAALLAVAGVAFKGMRKH